MVDLSAIFTLALPDYASVHYNNYRIIIAITITSFSVIFSCNIIAITITSFLYSVVMPYMGCVTVPVQSVKTTIHYAICCQVERVHDFALLS